MAFQTVKRRAKNSANALGPREVRCSAVNFSSYLALNLIVGREIAEHFEGKDLEVLAGSGDDYGRIVVRHADNAVKDRFKLTKQPTYGRLQLDFPHKLANPELKGVCKVGFDAKSNQLALELPSGFLAFGGEGKGNAKPVKVGLTGIKKPVKDQA